MVIAGHSASLALLISFAFGVADAIRTLKDGPMIDAEGREYKSATLRIDAEDLSRPQGHDRSTVCVRCTEASVIVVVKADLFKNGRLVSPGELYLGEAKHSQSSRCQAVAAGDAEYVIEVGLQDCGSRLSISEDSLIYSNHLIISPAARNRGIQRRIRVVIPVSCRYERTHTVSCEAQQPPLTLSTSAKYSTGHSAFSLKLMTDDWTSERSSSVFYSGDPLNLEASYTGPDSGRRRLFMDSCVATLSPEAASVPRYFFIGNHGCLTHAKGGSNAFIQPRTMAYSLQLQLDGFLFLHDSRNSIFITCQLKATSEMWRSSPINKACSYVHSRWRDVDGNDHTCRCCDSTCWRDETNRGHLKKHQDTMACGTVTLGPLMILPIK